MSEEKYVLEESPCSSGSLCMGYNMNGAHVGAQYGCTQGCLRHRRINSRQRKTDNMTEREGDTGVGRGEIREYQAPSWLLIASQFLPFYHSKLMIDKTGQDPVSNYWSQLWWVSVPKQWGCLLEHFTPSQGISQVRSEDSHCLQYLGLMEATRTLENSLSRCLSCFWCQTLKKYISSKEIRERSYFPTKRLFEDTDNVWNCLDIKLF